MTWDDKPIGYYSPIDKGLRWMIKIGENSFYDTESQDVAIEISELVKIRELLKNMK